MTNRRGQSGWAAVFLGAILGAALACAAGSGGCTTERVVSAKGFGSDRIQTQQPYQETYRVDDILLGPDPNAKKNPD